ncbi:type III pantothenate kinase [Mucilaginibacter sp.]|uniref:type III pantothenate kinase n=1 Tax=Mucilaginibacter sp. TaxID=1882438 RepID=UPI0028468F9A|nr:type III pantothenate kinase [Mucilaginibacter sp.]MDR3694109.1 type III pantothenate kinase [Mucilaginibacter sp.]
MNLVIDIGNTYTKIAVFKQDELVFNAQYQQVDTALIGDVLKDHPVSRAIISTVKNKSEENWQQVLARSTRLVYFNAAMNRLVKNHYLTPQTLGADRLAAVTGAHYLYPGNDNLVISGGTCITYDWVDAGGNYFGGSISPGLNMRYRALNNYTAGLPLVDPDESFAGYFGNNTSSSIVSGVQNGIKYELTGFIESYRANEKDLNIILSGGDSIFFDTLLKNSIFAPCIKIEPYLVLKGLNAAIHNNND